MNDKEYGNLPVVFTDAEPIDEAEIEEAVFEEIEREMEANNVQSKD